MQISVCGILWLSVSVFAQNSATASGCSIEKIVFVTGVQAREPIGASKDFS
jgi:hypothetical protein